MFTKENIHRLIVTDIWISLILIGFKIVGTISWSWTAVLSPLWIPLFIWCMWFLACLAIVVMVFITNIGD